MDWNQTCDRLRNRMFALARCPWEGKVECVQGPVLTAALEGDVLTIQAPDLSGAARGMFLSACALRDHQPIPALGQKRHIASCGMMVDMSRGGVMTVKGVKELIDAHAALGLNLMMLYTEDTYPVPEYPYLGYLPLHGRRIAGTGHLCLGKRRGTGALHSNPGAPGAIPPVE